MDEDAQCAWAGCGNPGTELLDAGTPVCDHHAALADRLLTLEFGFLLGLGMGGLLELIELD